MRASVLRRLSASQLSRQELTRPRTCEARSPDEHEAHELEPCGAPRRPARGRARERGEHALVHHPQGRFHHMDPLEAIKPSNHIKNPGFLPGKTASTDAPSKRTLRARARAAQHAALTQQALDFRARCVLSFWRRAATPSKPPQLQPSQLRKPLPPPPPPPPL